MACGDDPTIIDTTMGGNGGATANAGSGGRAGSSSGGSNSNSGGSGGSGVAGSNAGSGGSASTGPIEVSGDIDADTTWTNDNTYILTDKAYVVGNSTLTIEPGTTITGGGLGSALVITRGSRLVAEGTAAEPIVFTSNIPVGLRDPGDWGGVVLLGAANINVGEGQIEGLPAGEGRGVYGGTVDEHDCGSLKYVRIEFAGFVIGGDNELNGLTLGGCGSDTEIDYVQVHRGSDDGIEVFGGKVDIKHTVLSNIEDDSLDWDFGWTGRAQFLAIRHDAASDAAFEADNGDPATEAMPRSEPTIYNVTLVGSPTSRSPGMVLRRGTWGAIRNAIVTGFPVSGVDIRDAFSVDGAELVPPRLTIENSIFFANGEGGLEHADDEPENGDAGDDDANFDEDVFLRTTITGAAANQFDVDPGLPDAANVTAPNLVPAAGSPAAAGAAVPPAGFDTAADYIGAFEPGGTDWTAGWTSFPEN
jgi:hypothetical protein